MTVSIQMRYVERPTNLQEIGAFEKKIQAKLPEDYKNHLLKYNGGHVGDYGGCSFKLIEPITNEKWLHICHGFFTVNPDPNEAGIFRFYALYYGDNNSLWNEYEFHLDKVPKELIVIGDQDSPRICLCVRGENYGKVYLWVYDHVTYNSYENTFLIANSFSEFLEKLYIEEMEEELPRVQPIDWTKVKRKTNLKEIRAFEEKYGIQFPNDYVQYLLKYNGAIPSQNIFSICFKDLEGVNESWSVQKFYSINPEDDDDLEKRYSIQYHVLNYASLSELFPIASQVCICIRGENYGKVYYWDDNYDNSKLRKHPYDNMYLLADNFSELIEKLYGVKLSDETEPT